MSIRRVGRQELEVLSSTQPPQTCTSVAMTLPSTLLVGSTSSITVQSQPFLRDHRPPPPPPPQLWCQRWRLRPHKHQAVAS